MSKITIASSKKDLYLLNLGGTCYVAPWSDLMEIFQDLEELQTIDSTYFNDSYEEKNKGWYKTKLSLKVEAFDEHLYENEEEAKKALENKETS